MLHGVGWGHRVGSEQPSEKRIRMEEIKMFREKAGFPPRLERRGFQLAEGVIVLVGFSGSSCSGKTSLVNRLYEILKSKGYDVAMINDVARWVFNRYFSKYGSLDELRKDSKAYLRFQEKVFDEQLFLETELTHQYEIVLSDRTLFDNILYTIVYCDFKDVYHFFMSHSPIDSSWYDIIFLCEPLLNEDCNDGFRSQSDFYARFYHYKLLQNWIGRWGNVIVLKGDLDLEERCKVALKHIKRCLK